MEEDYLPPEILRQIQEQFPGMEIKFSMEGEDLPNDILEKLLRLEEEQMEDLMNGKCMDCGTVAPNWTPPVDGSFVPPKNWSVFTNQKNEAIGIQCPECDKEDDKELTLVPLE